MKFTVNNLSHLLHAKNTDLVWKLGIVFGLILISSDVFATDLLAGTTSDAIDTMKGTGRHWAYIIDGAVSIGAFAMTKKPTVFFSVLAVALAITAMGKLVGA